jgi:hypothetical protein
MLRGECQSCSDSGDNQTQVGALLGVAVKGVNCGKVTARFGQVCGDQRAVADDCRLEYNQEHGKYPGPAAKHPARRYEDEYGQQHREQSDERARFGEDSACIIRIEELAAHRKIARFVGII